MATPVAEDVMVSGFAAELVDEVTGASSRKWALLILLVIAALVFGGIGASRLRNR
jgi:hypothetical protein